MFQVGVTSDTASLELRECCLEDLPADVDGVLIGSESRGHLAVGVYVVAEVSEDMTELLDVETEYADLLAHVDQLGEFPVIDLLHGAIASLGRTVGFHEPWEVLVGNPDEQSLEGATKQESRSKVHLVARACLHFVDARLQE